jgi:metal-sulfur cluster biosynthetic enzyme
MTEAMKLVTKKEVLEALSKVYNLRLKGNVVELGLIMDIDIKGRSVFVKMFVPTGCPFGFRMAVNAEDEIKKLDGVDDVDVKVVL